MSLLLDQAFHTLETATMLEQEAELPVRNKVQGGKLETRWSVGAAARKYLEACSLMKAHIKENEPDPSKPKALLLEKIAHYEAHAANLLRREGERNDDDDRVSDVGLADREGVDGEDREEEEEEEEEEAELPPPPDMTEQSRNIDVGAPSTERNMNYHEPVDVNEPRDPPPPYNSLFPPPAAAASASADNASVMTARTTATTTAIASLDIPLISRLEKWKKSESLLLGSGKGGKATCRDDMETFEQEADTSLSNALDLDESGLDKEALAEYEAAAELYFAAAGCEKSSKKDDEEDSKGRLVRKLEGTIERLEQIKIRAKNDDLSRIEE